MICGKREKNSSYSSLKGKLEHSAYVYMLVCESENPDLLHEKMG